MKILVINGPNLNLLGKREPDKYGKKTLDAINAELSAYAAQYGVELVFLQSNLEGEIVTAIQTAQADGIVLNAGGYTHTSVAIRDAVQAGSVPVVETHLTNILAREEFRHTSMLAGVCAGSVMGFGAASYKLAIQGLLLLER